MQNAAIAADITMFRWINQEGHFPWMDPIMSMLSFVPLFWTVFALVCCALVVHCLYKYRSKADRTQHLRALLAAGLLIACTALLTDVATQAIKHATGRLRPYQELAGTRYVDKGVWVQRPVQEATLAQKGNSFISGHASNSMALAATLGYLHPALRPLVYVFPLSVGYSRVYLGKHYPSDVLFGWLTGWLISFLCYRVFKRRFGALTAKSAPEQRPFTQTYTPAENT